jgi:LmbE family N-acetylglucosaminyl deacetylase
MTTRLTLAARKAELRNALATSCGSSNLIEFGVNDQEASVEMANLAPRLARLFQNRQFDAIITHPYEGGHPDHDATAFAVHSARHMLLRRTAKAPALIEMTSYHADPVGAFVTSAFLPGGPTATCVELPAEDQSRNAR